MSKEDLHHLGELEGAQGYLQTEVLVECRGETTSAVAYVSSIVEVGTPSEKYIKAMERGTHDCGLPQNYLTSLTK